ncbi:unnamed protein product, partial [Ranitomeya imitator]
MKMERSKAEEHQKQISSLEEALNKQMGDYELLRHAEGRQSTPALEPQREDQKRTSSYEDGGALDRTTTPIGSDRPHVCDNCYMKKADHSSIVNAQFIICSLLFLISLIICPTVAHAKSEKVPKLQFFELQKKLDSCEKALAKKQFEIDEIKEVAAKHQADSETIDVLRAQ